MKKIHFVGIGGIGISALAKYYLGCGFHITGSDLQENEITKNLKKMGIKIFIGEHKSENVPPNASLLIYSPAVSKENVELERARRMKIPCLSYPQALGELTKNHFTIAICGTHGKSTTTALIGLILEKAGFDPTVILGTKLKEFKNSNCRVGKSKYLVIEADEHFGSFFNYKPRIIVLTSLDPDHLDFYKTFKRYVFAFKRFVLSLPPNGLLILNKDDKKIQRFGFLKIKRRIECYSLKEKEAEEIKRLMHIPGMFNVNNALGALKVARYLKIPDAISFKVFSSYRGSWRRFEVKRIRLRDKQIILIHDYAHHPKEVYETLKAVKEKFKDRKIICVFQPHQYQRTYYLFSRFVNVFKNTPVDELILTDIYEVAGRENEELKKKVSSLKLVEAVNRKNVIYVPSKMLFHFLGKRLQNRMVLIFMGAGDIYYMGEQFAKFKHL